MRARDDRKERVEAHFSAVARDYHRWNYEIPVDDGRYPDILVRHRRILEMVESLRGRALDIGCGSGRLLLDLTRRGFETVGIDLSPTMIDATRELFRRNGLAPPELFVADVESLPFGDGRFDLVTAGGVIEYLAEDDAALAEIRRVLAPGGRLVVSVRNARNLSRPLVLARDALRRIAGIGSVVDAAHRQFRRALPPRAARTWPTVRFHHPWRFRRTLARHGLEVEDAAYFHFAVAPPLVRRLAPRRSIDVGLALERLARTPLGPFGSAYLVKAAADARPAPRPRRAADDRPPTAVVVRLGLTGLGLVRSLSRRDLGARVPIVAVDGGFAHPAAATRLCQRWTCHGIDGPGLVDGLEGLGGSVNERPVLFLSDDASVLRVAAAPARLGPRYRYLLPSTDVVELLADKTRFAEHAERHGFPIPKTFVLRSREDLDRALPRIPFPCVLKPSWRPPAWESRRYPKAFVLSHPDHLRARFDAYRHAHGDFVVQEWIDGSDAAIFFCLVYFDARSRCIATFTGRKLRQWPCGAGNTSIAEPVDCPEVERTTRRLFDSLDYRGLGSVEFKYDPACGSFKILEPTVGRPNLQSELATANGVNLAWIAYCDLAGLPCGLPRRPRRPVRWVNELTDPRSAFRLRATGRLTVGGWLFSYGAPLHLAHFSWRDPMPFVAAARELGASVIRKGFRSLAEAASGRGVRRRAG